LKSRWLTVARFGFCIHLCFLQHKGNKRFRDVVALHRPDYVRAPRIVKPSVARVIVRAIRNGDHPGRFLRQDDKTGKWVDIGDKKAADKTSQLMREKKKNKRDKLKATPGSAATASRVTAALAVAPVAAAPVSVPPPVAATAAAHGSGSIAEARKDRAVILHDTPAVAHGSRSMAEAHKDRAVILHDTNIWSLPVGPYENEEDAIEAVRVWASKQETNGGGFGILKKAQIPATKTKGPRRLLMCEFSGKVKPSKAKILPTILHTKRCDCAWGVWIEQCVEGWTTVELPKRAMKLLSQPGATMASVHNHV
jgi:hypothetical protein